MSSRFFTTCPKGLESLLAEELTALGLSVQRETPAGVWVEGELQEAYVACLHSRLANRVIWHLAEAEVSSAADIHGAVVAIDWSRHLKPTGRFKVSFQGLGAGIRNTQFGVQCVKDGIVDRLRGEDGSRPAVDRVDPDLSVHVRLHRDRLHIGIDLAGASLHRRGYRTESGAAPLKENLAAALLLRAGWPAIAAAGGDFVDPLCGSGTLLVEAALMATDTAPGLLREDFALCRWPQHDADLWHTLREEARSRSEKGRAASAVRYFGYDEDKRVVATAWRNIDRVGFADRIHVERQSLVELAATGSSKPGLILTNPPYGERLSERDNLGELYLTLGSKVREHFQGWRFGVFTAVPEFGHALGLRPDRRYNLYNGSLPAKLLMFRLEKDQEARAWTPEDPDAPPRPRVANRERAAMLANRLRKNIKSVGAWARKRDLECFRLYDADMPEYSLAIDVYGEWLHVQEYQAPKTIDAATARERLAEAMAVIPEAVGVPAAQMVVKQRRRQRGDEQYERQGQGGHRLIVSEGSCRFYVNLIDYLDTGLFLDHRPARLWLGKQAEGKRVLNLFGYTGTATVHAALGGAVGSLTIDMSKTYLAWARENYTLNGVSLAAHRLEQADCLQWLAEPPKERFDLIFLDPPTFSNSARMDDVLDVQRDHERLVDDAMARLEKGGTLFFSNNYRRFKLSASLEARYQVENITRSTIDRDFSRNSKIHQAWLIRHQNS
ncbi:bifunctional 23S rRNA (guanine(2069)-N(7))-methyltransferase RlmK/23S rRNA (guanine(2445)-N(2))-methyltransferase RlmL [Hydrocarboniclastica marina]|uniref:Ribosomal RNA large subunit methyltransferase K/L n=1 Tax=Hydrocarboniclastica marina TaxID=2259620 RepID=A0A4P7XFL4_9ALTE|nr:bifunctional 23S rRNA (guanine(2069)-N(7))-methyltransferase RlmK/23S rRNA (guanine(2445)-N(2))-methyltransferase RlmL [Hydrocarboniclastica marina]QCF25751.1 bifunctional 23S rRNA (guanine(2069)-N(7))-methyltransferase RlmK/23S rRNA (guanine(2445)-N(2))-methyltransferase RlmL [Hydrocarboniclastica marina]